MPLDRQVLRVPLTAGLNQKADLRSLSVQGAAQMTNCVLQKTGAVRKRFGNQALPKTISQGGAIAAAVNAGSYKRDPILFDGEKIYAWSDLQGAWLQQDVVPDAVCLDRLGVASFTQPIADMDQASTGSLLFVVFTSDPTGLGFEGLFYTAIDLANNAPVVPISFVSNSLAVSAIAPKLILCGTTLVLTYINATAIVARTLSTNTPTAAWSAETTLATDGFFTTSTGVYDVAPTTGDATRFAIAYEVNPSLNTSHCVKIATYNVSGLSLNHAEVDDTAVTGHLTSIAVVSTSGEWNWAAYWGTTGAPATVVRGWAWNDGTPATHVAPFTVYTAGSELAGRIAAARTDSTDLTAYWSPAINTASNNGTLLGASYVRNTMLSTSGTFTRIVDQPGIVITSKPVATNAGAYIAVQTPSTNQGTAFLCRDDGWAQNPPINGPRGYLRAVATLDPRLMKNTSVISMQGTFWQTVPHIVPDTAVGPAVWLLPAFESTSPTHQAIYDFPIDLGSQLRYFTAELYELEAISAGVPSIYDGQGISEQSFLAYPEIASAVFSGTGGLLQTSGTYQYIVVYEVYDNRGQLTQSGTSPPFSMPTSGSGDTGSSVVTVPGLALTQRQNEAATFSPSKGQAYAILYRTTITVGGVGIFYRVSADPAPVTQQITGAGATIAITDTASDATISTHAVLYTTGGQLDNLNPPSARICIQHRNRWWYAGCPDPTALWPSKEITTGIVPGWNENQNFTCTGAIRALASMDDKLVIFVQRGAAYGIEFVTGEGPTDAGAQSDWTPPQRVPSDVGAVDQRSIVTGPFGTLFRSIVGGPTGAGGIFLLSRDLQVTYLSGPVEDTLSVNPIISSAQLHPNLGRVYFTALPTETGFSSGVRLVWDYLQGGVWSTDTLTDPDTAQTSAGGRCAFLATTTTALGTLGLGYHWVTSAGRVYRETHGGTAANAYLDAGQWISMTYVTALLTPQEGGFARFWRVQLEADCLEPANPASFTVALTFDGAPGSYYQEVSSWQGSSTTGYPRFPQIDIEMVPSNQKAKSIQVQYSDAISTILGGGPIGIGQSLGGIVLELAAKPGIYKNIPQAQRA